MPQSIIGVIYSISMIWNADSITTLRIGQNSELV